LAGQEVFKDGNGNLGLRDRKSSKPSKIEPFKSSALVIPILERLALKWVNKYIGAFGGDTSKVTM